MASTKLMETKDGQKFWKIRVSRGRGVNPYTTRFYWPTKANGEPVAQTTAEKALRTAVSEFERACNAGEVLSREEKKEKAAQEAAEAAKLKTVRQYADGVFMPTKEATISENARASYRMFLDRHILPVLGDSLLVDVSPAMISKLLLDFQKAGYAHGTSVKLYNILNGVFEMAFLDDSIPMNPMLKVKRPAPRKGETPKEESEKALTVQELARVLSCVDTEYMEALHNFEIGKDKVRSNIFRTLQWKTYMNLSADSGARRGELCGLQWKDIDWKSSSITIRRNLQYTPAAGIYETSPKNGKKRDVDIGSETLSLLRQLQLEQASSFVSKWVFTQNGTPDPMHPDTPTRYFKKFGKRYGIHDFHPHMLRHSSASIAITSGADVVSVSERLGHSDTAITLRMYAHANQESIRRAGQAVRDALKAQGA